MSPCCSCASCAFVFTSKRLYISTANLSQQGDTWPKILKTQAL
ncbi:MAG: hypothetical protein RL701_3681 [Pseudomonadota bacterium]|jgi:hypothetical protein